MGFRATPDDLQRWIDKGIVDASAVRESPVQADQDDDTRSERDFQADVVRLAKRNNWLVYHTTISKRSAPGFPDLCLVRGERLIFAELKSATGKTTTEQDDWLKALRRVRGVEVYLWRPTDWLVIEATLGGYHT